MTFDPIRALRREENSLELGNGEVSHITSQLRIQREMKSLGDLILDQVSSGNFSERQSRQCGAGFPAQLIIARATNAPVSFLELIGEHEYLAKLIAIHS